jgi:hypothetical protein
MSPRSLPFGIALLAVAWVGPAGAQTPAPGTGPLRQATFEIRNEVKVKVPDGARRIRVWMAVPQDNDPAQQVRDLKIEAPYPHRMETDSEGSKVVYLEVNDPKVQEFTIVETFGLTRKEIRDQIDPRRAKPLTDADRQRLARYLQPNKHVVIDDDIRKLANEIVGDETNPVLAARKLYDWVLVNVDYWVKDPKNKKASPVGSTTYCLTFRTIARTSSRSGLRWRGPRESRPRSFTGRSSSPSCARSTPTRAITAGPSSMRPAWAGSTTTSRSLTSTRGRIPSRPTTNGWSV